MKISILITAVVVMAAHYLLAGDVIMTEKAKSDILASVKAEKSIIPIDKQKLQLKKERMNAWIGGSMDLQSAAKRESKRFNRTSYKVIAEKDERRLLTERADSDGNYQARENSVAKSADPYMILYREGPMYFSFMKVMERKAQITLEKDEIVSMARDFVAENNMLEETTLDKIGSVEVNETRIDADGGSGKKSDDNLVMQNVIFRRTFGGSPVVNSQISIAIYPDTREILELANFDWPALQEDRRTPLSGSDLESFGIATAEETGEKIVRRINKVTGNYDRVTVYSVEQGWFQDNEELIPVLIVSYIAEFPEISEPEKHLEVVNLTGDEKVFGKDFRNDYVPMEYPIGQ